MAGALHRDRGAGGPSPHVSTDETAIRGKHETSGGENLVIFQSLIAIIIANEVNPQHYIADVLMRSQD